MKKFDLYAFFTKEKTSEHSSLGRDPIEGRGEQNVQSSFYTKTTERGSKEEAERLQGKPLREEYFLAMLCERGSCGHVTFASENAFCPKCGYTTKTLYDFYSLFGLEVSWEGRFHELQLSRSFRELSLRTHPDSYPEGELAASGHDDFTFVASAYELLSVQESRHLYHRVYRELIRKHFPERLAGMLGAMQEEAFNEKTNAVKPRKTQRSFGQRVLIACVTLLDMTVTGLIVLLVMRTYLWGAVLSLVGVWFYFRWTRRWLRHVLGE